jgi:hypothetical protein
MASTRIGCGRTDGPSTPTQPLPATARWSRGSGSDDSSPSPAGRRWRPTNGVNNGRGFLSLWLMLDGRGDSDSARCGDSGESVACRAGQPAGQGENVLGEFRWVENLELGTEDGHVDGEHVG